MPATSARKFSVLDAMVLVAATAAGFAWMRVAESSLLDMGWFFEDLASKPTTGARVTLILEQTLDVYPLLFTWTLGLMVLRLRRPRPVLWRGGPPPGRG